MVSARFAAVRLLPSPLLGLVMMNDRNTRPFSEALMRVRNERYCSAAGDCGANAATNRESRLPLTLRAGPGDSASRVSRAAGVQGGGIAIVDPPPAEAAAAD